MSQAAGVTKIGDKSLGNLDPGNDCKYDNDE